LCQTTFAARAGQLLPDFAVTVIACPSVTGICTRAPQVPSLSLIGVAVDVFIVGYSPFKGSKVYA
jgi:uncharacterized protein YqgC (DUF456 family)